MEWSNTKKVLKKCEIEFSQGLLFSRFKSCGQDDLTA